MSPLDAIAEAKIAAAIEAGELANLPGAGKPLDLDDDPLVPEHLRAAYRIGLVEKSHGGLVRAVQPSAWLIME